MNLGKDLSIKCHEVHRASRKVSLKISFPRYIILKLKVLKMIYDNYYVLLVKTKWNNDFVKGLFCVAVVCFFLFVCFFKNIEYTSTKWSSKSMYLPRNIEKCVYKVFVQEFSQKLYLEKPETRTSLSIYL